ncbi:uncharacterized protein M437DRAFT_10425, partial [Aureobasidium melanogenum CBS 110374]
ICCEADGAPVLQPCRLCPAAYCGDCIRSMFLEATRDSTSMPPRCCTILSTIVALDFLSSAEADAYRRKFEEWISTKKTYCPVPKCSRFIPDRAVLPPPSADPVTIWVLPAAACFSCPDCHIGICPSCKQVAHFGQPCDTAAQDHELAMLETYGYKKCPRCGHGVKRMYGCRHMQCRCGAHWCWGCLRAFDECDGGCDSPDSGSEDGDYIHPILTERPTDLDRGGRRVWEGTGAFFGEEPDDSYHSTIWSCLHVF